MAMTAGIAADLAAMTTTTAVAATPSRSLERPEVH
jgi:hypothetical protein